MEHLFLLLCLIYLLWLCLGFIAPWAFLQLWQAGATLQLRCAVASLVVEQGLGHAGFSSCSSWALEHRINSCGAWA